MNHRHANIVTLEELPAYLRRKRQPEVHDYDDLIGGFKAIAVILAICFWCWGMFALVAIMDRPLPV